MMIDDEQLLIRARELDPVALGALHQRFYEPVARYIHFKVGDMHTVEDLSGEVFVRVLQGLKRGQAWRDSPQGWVMGIARHVVADYYRQRGRLAEVELAEYMPNHHDGPLGQVLLGEQKQRLYQAIQRLTDEQRDVILLRFMEGIDIEGVAKAMNKTPGAVKGLQYRALRALAEILSDFVEQAAGVDE